MINLLLGLLILGSLAGCVGFIFYKAGPAPRKTVDRPDNNYPDFLM